MTRTRWIIFAVIVLATFGVLALTSGRDRVDVSNVDQNSIVREGENADHIYGDPDAKVVVIEYADFQCPACGSAFNNVTAIKEVYKDEIAFVFRHLPLTSIHPNALVTAYAAEAAALQGKFWEMHDLLFATQSEWENASTDGRGALFENYARQLGLNEEKFMSDIDSQEVKDKVAFDRALANKAGARATPTIFINGEQVSDDAIGNLVQGDGSQLRDRINEAIRETGGTVPEIKTSEETAEE